MVRGVVGKLVYASSPLVREKGFENKRLGTGTFSRLTYCRSGRGRAEIVSDAQLQRLAARIFPGGAWPTRHPLLGHLTEFDGAWVVERVDSEAVFAELHKTGSVAPAEIDEILRIFSDIPARIGLTGSLALGSSQWSDIDCVFAGSPTALRQVRTEIDRLIAARGAVVEHGFAWPVRARLDTGAVLCCFFSYPCEGLLATAFGADRLGRTVRVAGRVIDDCMSMAPTPVVVLDDAKESRVVVCSNMFKGALMIGDHVVAEGQELRGNPQGEGRYVALVDPFRQLNDWPKLFSKHRVEGHAQGPAQ